MFYNLFNIISLYAAFLFFESVKMLEPIAKVLEYIMGVF